MDGKTNKPLPLDRFLVQRQRLHPVATGELTRVITQVGVVAKVISSHMRRAGLEGLRGATGAINVQQEQVKKLDEVGNAAFVEAFEYVDIVGALVSEEMERPLVLAPGGTEGPGAAATEAGPVSQPETRSGNRPGSGSASRAGTPAESASEAAPAAIPEARSCSAPVPPGSVLSAASGKYVVLFDPVDGSSNLDVDCMVGSIFSIRRLKGDAAVEDSILERGSDQIAAGYLLYGPSTVLVYTAGDGVHSFVLDDEIGEFVLDHEAIVMPEKGKIVSANFGNHGKWSRPAKAFADMVMSGKLGAYSLRYSGALVADLHQILHHGGLYFYPDEEGKPEGKLRLLYECMPLAMIAEQAGGTATTGKERVMDMCPTKVHQRIPFAIGSRAEIAAFESAYGVGPNQVAENM